MIRDGKKLPAGVQSKVPGLVRSLVDDKEIVALYAFGSQAQNTLKPLSDLDFGVLFACRMDHHQRFDKHIELIGVFTDLFKTDEIDLINMNDAPSTISFHILKSGKLLLCNDRQALIDFREHIVKVHLDYKFKRDAFDAVFLNGVGYHG